MHSAVSAPSLPTPGLLRRLGAMVYDGLLLIALLMLATAIVIVPYDILVGRPYPGSHPLYRTLLKIYQFAVLGGFFVYFWTHGGQTLGMSAWRLRVVKADGGELSMRDALRRFGWAFLSLLPAGLGLWWSLFDRDRLAWHDRRSGSWLVRVPRQSHPNRETMP